MISWIDSSLLSNLIPVHCKVRALCANCGGWFSNVRTPFLNTSSLAVVSGQPHLFANSSHKQLHAL